MASRVVMPKLTDTMEEGVVVKWKRHEGESVWAGDVLAEIETDKAVMDLEAFSSGTLRRILASEGETVPSGKLIAVIAEPDEDISDALADTIAPRLAGTSTPAPTTPSAPRLSAPESSTTAVTREQPADTDKREVKASPRAKTIARERGISLSSVKGTGPAGRITEQDVVHAAKATPASTRDVVERPLSQMRKAIARTTTQSKAPVPHFYVSTVIAMEEAERLRSQFNKVRPTRVSINDLLLKSASDALVRHPDINVSYAGDVLRHHASIDIGIAVGVEDGLISPVLRDSGSKSLAQIAEEAKALIQRARSRQLTPEEYTGATFTVSNLGMYEVENFVAVLIPPEAAALAIGSIQDEPVVVGTRVRLGRRMRVTLSCDHRALDGVQAAKFLQTFKHLLEHPLQLILSDT